MIPPVTYNVKPKKSTNKPNIKYEKIQMKSKTSSKSIEPKLIITFSEETDCIQTMFSMFRRRFYLFDNSQEPK